MEEIRAYVRAHRAEMLALWEELVSQDSPTEDKALTDSVSATLRRELEKSGAEVRMEPNALAGDTLTALWGASNPGRPVLFCGHMDTVFAAGEAGKRPFRIENGRAYGPGALDMKGGLTEAVFVLRALSAVGFRGRPVRVVFAPDEEGGHAHSGAAETILRACEGACAAFNFETGRPGGIVTSRKGCARFRLTVTGVEAHSGICPENGRNAIEEMAHKILALQALNDPANGTSVSVGLIAGGRVINVIPANCEIRVDVRFTKTVHLDALMRKMREISDTVHVSGCSCVLTVEKISVPMEETEQNLALFRHVRRTSDRLGLPELLPLRTGGWSDSNLISDAGVPVVCAMGPVGEGNHTEREYADVESLFERTELTAVSILRLPDTF